jgi:hypothetical protein
VFLAEATLHEELRGELGRHGGVGIVAGLSMIRVGSTIRSHEELTEDDIVCR